MPRSKENILGSQDIPAYAYYGVHMARALDNFTVSGAKFRHFQRFIIALVMVKKASMAATVEFDLLPADKARAIDQVCDESISGKLHEHFVVDLIQSGAGTSDQYKRQRPTTYIQWASGSVCCASRRCEGS